jgi:hypothetical protein
MNRAWIPAGALAGVSVAGLIALGPLTMGTTVSFPSSVPMTQASKPSKTAVPVTYSVAGAAGSTATAALQHTRGGKAAASAATSSDTGYVGYRRAVTSNQASAPPKVEAPVKPKKIVKRPASIGTTGETNPSSGLAGGSNSSTSHGEQAATPSSAP